MADASIKRLNLMYDTWNIIYIYLRYMNLGGRKEVRCVCVCVWEPLNDAQFTQNTIYVYLKCIILMNLAGEVRLESAVWDWKVQNDNEYR